MYYLEDSATKSIILASDDIFLINNISSGILDNHLRSGNSALLSQANEHIANNADIGIALVNNLLTQVDLSNFEYTKEKIRLAKLRKPLFEELLANVRLKTASNKIGFIGGDEVYIQYALENKDAMAEYASVLNMPAEFAYKELKLISESVIKNNFRIFTVASQFKEKINNTYTDNDAESIRQLIRLSFNIAGMVNV